MPSKRDSSVTDLTVQILGEIRDEARNTNVRLDGTNARLDGLTERVDGLQLEMRQGFAGLRAEMHQGFDHLGDVGNGALEARSRQLR